MEVCNWKEGIRESIKALEEALGDFQDFRRRLGFCWKGPASQACQVECGEIQADLDEALMGLLGLERILSGSREDRSLVPEALPEDLLL